MVLPYILENAGVLAAFLNPNRIEQLCSWGFTQLPPTSIFNDLGNQLNVIDYMSRLDTSQQ
jgi:hypothetical protein